jgi:hypothetical protein
MYAETTDVNRWLDGDVLQVTSGDYVSEEDSAERIIRGYLTGKVDGATMNGWTTPSSTPEMIREIAGQLVAAFRYRKMYSEDSGAVDTSYGQLLYNEAMMKLNSVVQGDVDLVGVDPTLVTAEHELTQGNFYPDDTTQGTTQDRRFSWDFEF